MNQKIKKVTIITIISIAILVGGYYGIRELVMHILVKQLGQLAAGSFGKILKNSMEVNYIYTIFNIETDTIDFADSSSEASRTIKIIKSKKLSKNEEELLRDAYWIKRFIERYIEMAGHSPDLNHLYAINEEFKKDHYGNKYLMKLIGEDYYIGTYGKDKKWNISREALNEILNSEQPLIYRKNDDMLIKLVPQKKQIDY